MNQTIESKNSMTFRGIESALITLILLLIAGITLLEINSEETHELLGLLAIPVILLSAPLFLTKKSEVSKNTYFLHRVMGLFLVVACLYFSIAYFYSPFRVL